MKLTKQSPIRPRAKLLELLGDQLIRHHRLAVFELVKNAFDADSPNALVEFHNVECLDDAKIIVRDTGEGMDIDTITGIWLEPASNHRAIQRKHERRTPKYKRLPVGEKGVGRFAVQKLGDQLRMVTRRKSGIEYVIDINWNELSDIEYLEDVQVSIHERTPTEFPGNNHGTYIEISRLKQQWTRGDVRRLHRTINAMVSPFDNRGEFKVKLALKPDPSRWLEDLFTAEDAKDAALFNFEFILDSNGLEWTYNYSPYTALATDYPGISSRTEKKERSKANDYFTHCPPDTGETWKKRSKRAENFKAKELDENIGPIIGQFTVFYLEPKLKRYLGDNEGLTRFLKEQAGVRVYRDGLRVFDYGEPGIDWLGLDVRRVNAPTTTLSNNLVLGEILLDLSASKGLKEKTNREGFVENEAFREFAYAIRVALTEFEAQRNIDIQSLKQAFKVKEDPEGAKINSPEAALNALRKKVVKENLSATLGKYVDRVEKTYEKARDVMMSAVGAGMGLSIVFHEMERGVKHLERSITNHEDSEKLIQLARQLVEVLEGAAYLVRKSDREKIKASELVRWATLGHTARFRYHKVTFINGFDNLREKDFSFKGSRRMLTAALSNLVDNAIHWAVQQRAESSEASMIWIGPSHDLEAPAIIVADTGSGFSVPEEQAIEPFFTTKMDGMGLGLYFVNMAMNSHGGRLVFPEKADVEIPVACTGAIAAMVFKGGSK
jgi:anti-sigma regulatory factor (Ser/Thr protein kinase)